MALDHPSNSTPPKPEQRQHRLAVIGGGLAGLAAACALSGRGYHVHLFEARRQWGGRAGSYRETGRPDSETPQTVDHCQHVAMGCCTNFLHFCREMGVSEFLRRDRVLHFLGPDGQCARFTASRWLPTPLHLGPALAGLPYLRWRDKLGIAQAMWNLLRTPLASDDHTRTPTVAEWLFEQRQSKEAIERFWAVVLVSALGETLDRVSFRAAHKVFLDGFLTARSAYELWIPTVPLETLYGSIIEQLASQGVELHLGERVESIAWHENHGETERWRLHQGGVTSSFAGVVIAVSWRRLADLWKAPEEMPLPHLAVATDIQSSPITAVHLWLDRPIFSLPHAVTVGRLSQWVFRRVQPRTQHSHTKQEHYYQVVISASRQLEHHTKEAVRDEVLDDLRTLWPAARRARLLRWRVVTQTDAVFSNTPEFERHRLGQATPYPMLAIAGDWTDTGWPSTMEGAVRSGYLAAEEILRQRGESSRLVQPDLRPSPLTRLLRLGTFRSR